MNYNTDYSGYSPELDHGKNYTGFKEALASVRNNLHPLGVENRSLESCTAYVTAEDVISQIDNPSHDVSLKDGYAVRSMDVMHASSSNPVTLSVTGNAFAGLVSAGAVTSGHAIRITSGSFIPQGADSVVAEEFCREINSMVVVMADAELGRNIMHRGQDIKAGAVLVKKGSPLLPTDLGMIAAAGISKVRVHRRPLVAILAIGDEVVAPGSPLQPGQLYASNIVTIMGWLSSFGIEYENNIVKDVKEDIKKNLLHFLPRADAILTSGGAWGSERDMTTGVMDELGWDKKFHHVRMGPGKGVVFGLCHGKAVFCLPGGPASNEMAFLQLALPGMLGLAGYEGQPLPTISAKLTETVSGRHRDWTEFRDATIYSDPKGNYFVKQYYGRSRLQAIAQANCLICIPEGNACLKKGTNIKVQALIPAYGALPITRQKTHMK